MFFFFPIGFDKPFHRVPWVNFGIVAACVLLFVMQNLAPDVTPELSLLTVRDAHDLVGEGDFGMQADFSQLQAEITRHQWYRRPWTLLTHAFLHADIFHLVGNMVFLAIFGSALNSDLGHRWYAAFYFGSALAGGIGELLLGSPGMVLGASGAIAGVTGMAAALYPRNEVRFAYLFWVLYRAFAGTVGISLIWVAAFYAGCDLFSHLMGDQGVAYLAHLGGYSFGFAIGIVALRSGWVTSDGNDFITWYMKGRVAKSEIREAPKIGKRGPYKPVRRDPAPDLPPIRIEEALALEPGEKLEETSRGSAANLVIEDAHPNPAQRSDAEPAIPLAAEETDPDAWAGAHEDTQADSKPEPPRKRKKGYVGPPVYLRLSRYFDSRDSLSDIPSEDVPDLFDWYDHYREVHAGAAISRKALLGVAKLAEREGDVPMALDAYDRLLYEAEILGDLEKSSKLAALAWNAAVLASKHEQHEQATEFARRALLGKLPAEIRPRAERLACPLPPR